MNSETSPLSSDRHPKLSIQLLFIWLTLSAIGIVFSNWQFTGMMQSVEEDVRSMVRLTQFMAALGAAIAAAQLIGMGVLTYTWRKTNRLLSEPGHWLVWIACLSMLFQFVSFFVQTLNSQIDAMEIDWTLSGWKLRQYLMSGATNLLMNVVPIGLNLFAARRHRGLWRVCFVASVLPILFGFAFPFLWGGFNSKLVVGGNLIRAFPPVIIVYAAFSEKIQGVQRDWVHWVGVTASAAGGLIMLSYAVITLAT